MRLSQHSLQVIQQAFEQVFGGGRLYLFGSRVDDTRKGGDIDLYIEPDSDVALGEKRLAFLALIKRQLGQQRIDLVLDRGEQRPIDVEARQQGVLLWPQT